MSSQPLDLTGFSREQARARALDRLHARAVPEAVRHLTRTLSNAGHTSYLVGGSVRDALLGRATHDFDLATSARPEQVIALFPRVIATGLQHGTVTVVEDGEPYEVTTFRGEGSYSDGRRPDAVTFLDDVQGDLARRDFTVNAIAFDVAPGRVVDPFGGLEDLLDRRLRAVGDAKERFLEDGLRAMRAVRFASALRFHLEPETKAAIPGAKATFDKVAVERIAEELRKLLRGPRPSFGLRLIGETGLAHRVLPALSNPERPDVERRLQLVDRLPSTGSLRLAALFAGESSALKALKPAQSELEAVRRFEALALLPWSEEMEDAALRRWASRLGPLPVREALLFRSALDRVEGGEAGRTRFLSLRSRLRALLAENPPLQLGQLAFTGDDAARVLGGRGPRIGKLLQHLLDRVLEEPARNAAAALEADARAWAAQPT